MSLSQPRMPGPPQTNPVSSVRSLWHPLRRLLARLEWVGRTITRVINLLLIVLVYFLAVGPLFLVLKLARRLPLDGERRPGLASHWTPRQVIPASLERFRLQF